MKKIFYFTAAVLLALLPGGCFEDKGNYNYLTFGDVTVETVSGLYEHNAKLGDHLSIPAKVTIIGDDISESDLTYQWELKNSSVFVDLPDQTGKNFDRDLGPDDYFNSYSTYMVRLKVMWKSSNGVDFEAYSPLVSIVISGDVGLMVMHGDASGVDIGLIGNDMFLVSATATTQERISYDNYSSINGGKIPGAGVSCMQQDISNVANAWIYAFTGEGMTYFSPITFERLGDYDDLFYSNPEFKFYQGKPEAILFQGYARVMIDGGDVFRENAPTKYLKRVEFTNTATPMPDYKMSKHSVFGYGKGSSSYMSSIFFDEIRRGFVRLQFGNPSTVSYYNSNKGLFNPNDMQADLLYFGWGGMANNQNNFLGIFEDDSDKVFIGEFKFDAPDEEGNTYARFKYDDLSSLPDFGDAEFYGFGINNTMCYYATDDAVYQFSVMGASGVSTGKKLLLGTDGDAAEMPFSGEITMMKVLRPSLTSATAAYKFYGEVLLVGTYENGEGALYAVMLDQMTGNALSYLKYTGFDRIYDANLKTR